MRRFFGPQAKHFSTRSILQSKKPHWQPRLADVTVVDFQSAESIASELTKAEDRDSKSFDDIKIKELRDVGDASVTPTNALIKAFLYGATPQCDSSHDRNFSQLLGNKSGVTHEITYHWVKPSRGNDYVNLMESQYMNSDQGRPPNSFSEQLESSRLVGAWKAVIGGDLDTYVHIWEHTDITSLHTSHEQTPRRNEFEAKLSGTLRKRSSEILQEFAFWGGIAKPRSLGGIFELRKYELQPGKMLEWEYYWRKGIEHRREVMEPVGAWFTNIGSLNQVYHLWQFADLHHRKVSRSRSWEKPGWAETTRETVKLLNHMESIILLPLKYSPLK